MSSNRCESVAIAREPECGASETRDGESMGVVLSNRRFLYAYAARAFSSEPDEAFLDVVSQKHSLEECSLLDDGLSRGRMLQEALATAVMDDRVVCRLSSEYTKLFIGPGKLPAPPWESVFVSRDGILFTEQTLAVREAYRAWGLQAVKCRQEPDDHLATELDFMSTLAARTEESFQSGDKEACRALLVAQGDFLAKHLLAWIGDFSARMNEVDGISAFYPSFASLVDLVCRRDFELVEELLAAME